MLSFPGNTALILIDIQKGFDDAYWGHRNNPDAEQHMARLLKAWRQTGRPIIHIQHNSRNPQSPLYPGSPGHSIKDLVSPQGNEPVLQKEVNSAFIGTDLEARLRQQGITTVVIVGLTTNHCVETTTRMAGNLGFDTYLVSDATATFDRRGPDGLLHTAEEIQSMTMSNLNEEFATIVTTDEVLNALLSVSTDDILLRDVLESDLPIFFEQQLDPDANYMAAFTAKNPADRAAFMAHWTRIMNDVSTTNKTILFHGQVAGHISSYEEEAGKPEVTYWLGKDYWGKSIATRALTAFLKSFKGQTMYARVAKDNPGSLRVLQKCGFAIYGEGSGFANAREAETEEFLLRRDG